MEKLRAQKDYLEAEENGDLEKMRQIAIKFGSSLSKSSRDTPAPCKNCLWGHEGFVSDIAALLYLTLCRQCLPYRFRVDVT